MEERKGLLSNKVHLDKYPDASWAYSPEYTDEEDQLEKEKMMQRVLWQSYQDETTKRPRDDKSEERRQVAQNAFKNIQNRNKNDSEEDYRGESATLL